MLRRLAFLPLMVLAACGSRESAVPAGPGGMATLESRAASDAGLPQADAGSAALVAVASAPAPAPPPPLGAAAAAVSPTEGAANLIAYSYSMSLELPAAQVIAARDAHLQACLAAGPARCQLLGSSSHAAGDDRVSAQLQLRGEPQWLQGFRAAVAADATKLDGRVVGNSIGSEDLTRQVIDTEATLRAQTRLRERLTELLTRHQGKLADLLEVERELARVQGEIDARSSELNVMRKRIAMSDLTIAYQSRGLFVDDRTADPTLQALRDFLATVSLSFAAAIRFVAVALPWLLIVLPAFWLLRRMWRRRAGKLRSPDS
ncbi:MAG: DUF4349 domain-containing protein [Gammaproteobacteria bacterium]|nr:DUF4349 domain-containing protein [Gammaproteobacteria bacterium]